MTQIGFIGTGTVAHTLAKPLTAAGHHITFATRGADGTDLTPADVVINCLPGDVSLAVLTPMRPALAGKVLVDVANAVVTGDDGFAAALRYPADSLAERLQSALPETGVVKTLNTMHVSLMTAPITGLTAFLSGDSAEAKALVAALLGDLGWSPERVLDLGGVRTARWVESFALGIKPLVQALGPVPFGLSVAR